MALMPVEEALARILSGVEPLSAEIVPLTAGAGRVLAQDLMARLTQPPFDSAAMDGYAVRAADCTTLPARLTVIGQSAAGHGFSGRLSQGKAVRIFTGAPVPEGADTIVIQENTRRNGETVEILEPVRYGQHVRSLGGDFREGDALLKAGTCLTARDLMLAAAMNHKDLPVIRKPVVALLATGDELVPPGDLPRPDQIISSVPAGLAAVVGAAGGEPRLLGIAKDTHEDLERHIAQAQDCDILVTIGGASVGEHDLVQTALKAQGMKLDFYKIAMRPGKPLMSGWLGAMRVLGLPGNPISAFICARIFLYPLIRRLAGHRGDENRPQLAVAAASLEANGDRAHYMRGELFEADGVMKVRPLANQDSSLMSQLAKADCLILRAPHAPAAMAGDRVEILPFDF